MSVNRIILLGNLGSEPDIKQVSENLKVAKVSIATSRKYKGETKTTWHNLVAYNHLATLFENYLHKGDHVYIEGEQSNRSYEKDGVKHYVSEVIVNTIDFINTRQHEKAEQNDLDKMVPAEDDLGF